MNKSAASIAFIRSISHIMHCDIESAICHIIIGDASLASGPCSISQEANLEAATNFDLIRPSVPNKNTTLADEARCILLLAPGFPATQCCFHDEHPAMSVAIGANNAERGRRV